MMRKLNFLLLSVFTLIFIQACESETEETGDTQPTMREAETPPQSQLDIDIEIIQDYMRNEGMVGDRTATGLHYVLHEQGEGERAVPGKTVEVHYTGYLLDGTVFDSSHERNQPIDFVLGQGMVIQGWDEGIALLKEGGSATLLIPSDLAYGPRGAGDVIPPNAVLRFDVELISVQ